MDFELVKFEAFFASYIYVPLTLCSLFFTLLITFVQMETPLEELPVYTRSQLALRNGQDKPEVWIAFKGLIYDVTKSRLWRNGMHYEHWSGQDLTPELKDAPHTDYVFDKFRIIGKLL